LSQTSRNGNHTANLNCCQRKKNLQVRCDKKSQENKFKHFIEDQYEMIMESVLQLADCKERDWPSATDIVSLPVALRV
jgi:hypothetical protein